MRSTIPYLTQEYGLELTYTFKITLPTQILTITEFAVATLGELSSQAKLDGASTYSSVSISIIDETGVFVENLQSSILEGRPCEIWLNTKDLVTGQTSSRLWFKGRTSGAPTWNEENNQIALTVETAFSSRPIDTSLDTEVPGILTPAINKFVPVIHGWGYQVPAVRIKGTIRFQAAITGSCLDQTLNIPGGSALPQNTPIFIFCGAYTLKGTFNGDVFAPDYNWNGQLYSVTPLPYNGPANVIHLAPSVILHDNFVPVSFYAPNGSLVYLLAQVTFAGTHYVLTLPLDYAAYPTTVNILGYFPPNTNLDWGFWFDGEYPVSYFDPVNPGVSQYVIFGDGTSPLIKKIEAKYGSNSGLYFLPGECFTTTTISSNTLDGRHVDATLITVNEYAYGSYGMDFSEIYVTCTDVLTDAGIHPQNLLAYLVNTYLPGYTAEFPATFTTKTLFLNFVLDAAIDPFELISQVAREALLSTTIDGSVIRFRDLLVHVPVFGFTNDNILNKAVSITHRPESEIQNEITATSKMYTSTPTYVFKYDQTVLGKRTGSMAFQYWRELEASKEIARLFAKRLAAPYRMVTFQSTVDAMVLEPYDVVSLDTELIASDLAVVLSVATDSGAMSCEVTLLLVDEDYFTIEPFTCYNALPPWVAQTNRPTFEPDKYDAPKNVYRMHMVTSANTLYANGNPISPNHGLSAFQPLIIPAYCESGINFEVIITQYLLWWSISGAYRYQDLLTLKCAHAGLSLPGLNGYGWKVETQRDTNIVTIGDSEIGLSGGRSGPWSTRIYPSEVPIEPGTNGSFIGVLQVSAVKNDMDIGVPTPFALGEGDLVQPRQYQFMVKENVWLSVAVINANEDKTIYPFAKVKIHLILDPSFPDDTLTVSFKALTATKETNSQKWVMKEVEVKGITDMLPKTFTKPVNEHDLVFTLLTLPPELENLYIVAYETFNANPPNRPIACCITPRQLVDPSADTAVVKIGHIYKESGEIKGGGQVFYCTVYAKGSSQNPTLQGDPMDWPTPVEGVPAITTEMLCRILNFEATSTELSNAVASDEIPRVMDKCMVAKLGTSSFANKPIFEGNLALDTEAVSPTTERRLFSVRQVAGEDNPLIAIDYMQFFSRTRKMMTSLGTFYMDRVAFAWDLEPNEPDGTPFPSMTWVYLVNCEIFAVVSLTEPKDQYGLGSVTCNYKLAVNLSFSYIPLFGGGSSWIKIRQWFQVPMDAGSGLPAHQYDRIVQFKRPMNLSTDLTWMNNCTLVPLASLECTTIPMTLTDEAAFKAMLTGCRVYQGQFGPAMLP